MNELKKLSCGINLSTILGKSYEKNIIDLISMICEDAMTLNVRHIHFVFYHDKSSVDIDLVSFMSQLNKWNKFIKLCDMTDYNYKIIWFSILTKDEFHSSSIGRTYYILDDVCESSLTSALLNYHTKVKLQSKLLKNGK